MDASTVEIGHDTEKIIIDGLKMYRNPQMLRSNAVLQNQHAVPKEYIVDSSVRSVYVRKSDTTHTTDSSQYLSNIHQQNGLRDNQYVPFNAQQSPQRQSYIGSCADPDAKGLLTGYASAGSSVSLLPKGLRDFLDASASTFQEAPMMASAREEPQHRLVNKVPDELVCALCGEMYNDPRLLPCLHTFCKRCLEHTVNPRSATITCHSCRKEVSLMVCEAILILKYPLI